jgi:hypothetical protein
MSTVCDVDEGAVYFSSQISCLILFSPLPTRLSHEMKFQADQTGTTTVVRSTRLERRMKTA